MNLPGVVVGIIIFGGSAALSATATVAAAGALVGLIVAGASAVKD